MDLDRRASVLKLIRNHPRISEWEIVVALFGEFADGDLQSDVEMDLTYLKRHGHIAAVGWGFVITEAGSQ